MPYLKLFDSGGPGHRVHKVTELHDARLQVVKHGNQPLEDLMDLEGFLAALREVVPEVLSECRGLKVGSHVLKGEKTFLIGCLISHGEGIDHHHLILISLFISISMQSGRPILPRC